MATANDEPVLCDPSFQAAHARLERMATLVTLLPWNIKPERVSGRLGALRRFRFVYDPRRGRTARSEEWTELEKRVDEMWEALGHWRWLMLAIFWLSSWRLPTVTLAVAGALAVALVSVLAAVADADGAVEYLVRPYAAWTLALVVLGVLAALALPADARGAGTPRQVPADLRLAIAIVIGAGLTLPFGHATFDAFATLCRGSSAPRLLHTLGTAGSLLLPLAMAFVVSLLVDGVGRWRRSLDDDDMG